MARDKALWLDLPDLDMSQQRSDAPICPVCNSKLRLLKGKYGLLYRCRNVGCDITHSAHPDGRPVGVPTDSYTRHLRHELHRIFDLYWKFYPKKQQEKARKDSYLWLSQQLEITEDECHIGRFDADACLKAINICRRNPEWQPFEVKVESIDTDKNRFRGEVKRHRSRITKKDLDKKFFRAKYETEQENEDDEKPRRQARRVRQRLQRRCRDEGAED